jgi:uncharacterized RDD family membrane protein YckC
MKLNARQKYWIMLLIWFAVVQVWSWVAPQSPYQWIYWLGCTPGIALFFIFPRRWRKQEEAEKMKGQRICTRCGQPLPDWILGTEHLGCTAK